MKLLDFVLKRLCIEFNMRVGERDKMRGHPRILWLCRNNITGGHLSYGIKYFKITFSKQQLKVYTKTLKHIYS